MSIVNNYKPPVKPTADEIDLYGSDPYDINFVLGSLDLSKLQSDKVKLVYFIPRLHTDAILTGIAGHADLFRFLPFDMSTPASFAYMAECRWRADPLRILLTILDTTREGHPIAGLIGLIKTDVQNLVTEIGPIVVLPAFAGTHVVRHASALLTRYVFDLPSAGGLGFRRLQWAAHPDNVASIKCALRLGMKEEALTRWACITPHEGLKPRTGDPNGGHGRHTASLAVCWDDWESGGREKVMQLLAT